VTVRLARTPTVGHLAAALAGLLLGACSGTLHDAAGVPPLPPGGTTCDPPQHVCGEACVAQSVAACGDACAVCTASDPNATPTCEPGAGGSPACGQACNAGWLPCSSGCCRASAVAAGDDHACAVTSDGGLACWGKNDAGQLGPAAAGLARSERPMAVLASGVTAVAAGGRHTCAVQGGTVRCWGANEAGQLGDGTAASTPAIVTTGLTGATALALGASHGCAIVGSGAAAAVWCWGANGAGQLGTGDFTPHAAPFPTLVTSGTTALSAAGDDTCAVAAGVASCWGLDLEGQTGFGSDPTTPRPPRPTPTAVPLPGPALAVAVGRKHACASASVGGGTPLHCWGSGGEGEMGNGGQATPVLAPVQASVIDNGQRAGVLAAGEAFTCTAKIGEVSMNCNGRNDQAQCGLAPSGTPVLDRIDVSFGGTVLVASAGRAFSCALVDLGGARVVKCWGSNTDGQLGRSTPASGPSPTPDLVGN
jgi:Regulator of chromosome condensation (RCC1) repeat